MAGLFPVLEFPRRRRRVGGDRSRCPPFYDTYVSSHDDDLSSATWRHAGGGYTTDDVKLGGVAGEAKARLDAKLRSQLKSDLTRLSFGASRQSSMHAAMRTVQTAVFGMGKDSSSRKMGKSSGRTSWESTEQDECAVCLERFRVGENLMNLRCTHRFHTRCLVPWLETNTRCPCCRTDVLPSSASPPW